MIGNDHGYGLTHASEVCGLQVLALQDVESSGAKMLLDQFLHAPAVELIRDRGRIYGEEITKVKSLYSPDELNLRAKWNQSFGVAAFRLIFVKGQNRDLMACGELADQIKHQIAAPVHAATGHVWGNQKNFSARFCGLILLQTRHSHCACGRDSKELAGWPDCLGARGFAKLSSTRRSGGAMLRLSISASVRTVERARAMRALTSAGSRRRAAA